MSTNRQMICFFTEETRYRLRGKIRLKRAIAAMITGEGFTLQVLNVILCSDDFLMGLNRKFLQRNYLTDVISFDLSESDSQGVIQGELYISMDRVKENARLYGVLIEQELYRMIIHGLLHLMGMEDGDSGLRAIMAKREDDYLKTLFSFENQ